jgi:putative membrane protein
MNKHLSIYATIAAALLVSTASAAQLPKTDEAFLKKAGASGLAEMKLGELAKEKGTRQDVKDYGAMMVNDHGKANSELESLAQKKAVQLPTELKGKHEAAHNRLSKLSGADFDKAYLDQMVKDHEAAVKDFENASKNAKDSDVKTFAEKTLPTLKAHLERSRQLQGAQ